MPISDKYGRVTLEKGDVGEDEPVFIFRAKDRFIIKVLAYYIMLCRTKTGATRDSDHVRDIRKSGERINAWQDSNGSKIPD